MSKVVPDPGVPGAWLAWLEALERVPRRVSRLAGDVSARQYFRLELSDGGSEILVHYPSTIRETCRRFLVTTSRLQTAGVLVPRILQAECSDGLVLVEDVGAETLYDKASSDWRTLTPYYEDACRSIEKIRAIPLELCGELNPPLDAALLWRELQQTWDLFLEPNHLTGFRSGAIRFRAALERLCTVLGEDRMVTSHRDFMPRNLIPLADAPLSVVLDHQDLRPGPEFYDVASLLNDSLFPPAELERRLLRPFVSNRDDQIRYHRTAAQRTLKAVGTYAAFARRGARRHDRLIPLTLGRAFEHLSRVPETEALVADLGTAWRRISAHDR